MTDMVGLVRSETAGDIVLDRPMPGGDGASEPVLPASIATPRVLFVTPEMGDFIKAGGLGEVSSSLPRQLNGRCDVRVLIPGYRQVRQRARAMEIVRSMPAAAGLPPWSLGRITMPDGLVVYAVLCDELYDRDGSPYGPFGGRDYADNDIRFGRLSMAAAELAAGEADPNWKPDILHVNDWPAALAPLYLAAKPGTAKPKSILTIHNLAYQGLYGADRLATLCIPERAFTLEGAEFHGQLSFLKAGISFSSHLTTVSETYAREITTPDHGCGLDGLLRKRFAAGELTGITNGIDDHMAPLPENDDMPGPALAAWKRAHARRVRRLFGLTESRGPLFAIISRLVHQKGIDLSIATAENIIAEGGQLVVTGRGEPELEDALERLAQRYPDQVGVHIGFDDAEAKQVFAASDFLLMPSRFEPCGLGQMYAQRAGSLPIAYRTGGLADTIDDGSSGFLFSRFDVASLSAAMGRALDAFRHKAELRKMRKNARAKRFDWSRATGRYAKVYRQAMGT
jgi:starch synthase